MSVETTSAVPKLQDLFLGNVKIGVKNPFAFYVNQDAKRTSKYAVYVSQSGLTMPDRDYYLKDEDRFKRYQEALTAYISKSLAAVGHPQAEKAAADILALEKRIAEVQWSRVENRNPLKTYNKLTQAEIDLVILYFELLQK